MKLSIIAATLFLIAPSISSAWKFSSDKENEPKTGYYNTRCTTVSHNTGGNMMFQDEESYYRWQRNYSEPGAHESPRSCCLVLYNSELCDIGNGQIYQRICETEEAGYTDNWPIKRFKVEGCENVNNSGSAPPDTNNAPYIETPQCFWETTQRNTRKGRCMGSWLRENAKCQNLSRRECLEQQ